MAFALLLPGACAAKSEGTEEPAKESRVESPEIHIIAPGKHKNYYHIRFVLTPENTRLSVSAQERTPRYGEANTFTFTPGGQFEVFVPVSRFPVPAPASASYVVVRMPWTNPDLPRADTYIAEKRALFDAIARMKRSGAGEVPVVLELNPYVEIASTNPLRLRLTQPNAFFRQAGGRYIDHVGPLSPDHE